MSMELLARVQEEAVVRGLDSVSPFIIVRLRTLAPCPLRTLPARYERGQLST